MDPIDNLEDIFRTSSRFLRLDLHADDLAYTQGIVTNALMKSGAGHEHQIVELMQHGNTTLPAAVEIRAHRQRELAETLLCWLGLRPAIERAPLLLEYETFPRMEERALSLMARLFSDASDSYQRSIRLRGMQSQRWVDRDTARPNSTQMHPEFFDRETRAIIQQRLDDQQEALRLAAILVEPLNAIARSPQPYVRMFRTVASELWQRPASDFYAQGTLAHIKH